MILDPHGHAPDLRTIKSARLPVTWRSPIAKAGDQPPDYQWLHDIADAASPFIRRAFLAAIDKVRGTLKEAELVAAIESKSVDRVMQVLDLDKSVAEALAPEFQAKLEDTFVAAGRTGAVASLPTEIAASLRFDLTNPNAVAFLRSYEFGLIRQVTTETRDAVRTVVLDAFENGGHPREQARAIRDFIGLTDRQAQAVINYRDALTEEARPADQVERMTEKYRQRMLRLRAETIARTETIRASNAGQHASWQQAASQGLLNRATTRRKWVVTLDDRLCLLCAAIPLMNPKGVTLDGYFATPQGPVMYPPLHPQCRCVASLSAF